MYLAAEYVATGHASIFVDEVPAVPVLEPTRASFSVIAVDVSAPERTRVVPVAAPIAGVVSVGDVKVLFVSVYVPASETKSASVTAVLNSASVPVTVFVPNAIDLFVNVFVDDALTVISEVRATVPVASGNVIVRSPVGSVTVSVVSKSFAVEPSITILASESVSPETTGDVRVLFVRVSETSLSAVPFE